jgi:PPOX class probable F420-dependent enzyme
MRSTGPAGPIARTRHPGGSVRAVVAKLPESAISLIESGAHGHLVTINPDGSPQVSMVWVGVEDDELCVASMSERQKLRNVQRDPRVAITFESREIGGRGLLEYLSVVGTARITEGGAAALLQRLAQVYIGPGSTFPPGDNPPPGYIMRVTPDRWQGHGPWAASP